MKVVVLQSYLNGIEMELLYLWIHYGGGILTFNLPCRVSTYS